MPCKQKRELCFRLRISPGKTRFLSRSIGSIHWIVAKSAKYFKDSVKMHPTNLTCRLRRCPSRLTCQGGLVHGTKFIQAGRSNLRGGPGWFDFSVAQRLWKKRPLRGVDFRRVLPCHRSVSAFASRFWILNFGFRIFLNMPLVVIGLSHHSSPVELRERFAFAEARIPDALERLRNLQIADEAVILSTCNRVEIYAATPLEAGGGLRQTQEISGHLPRLSRPARRPDLRPERTGQPAAPLPRGLRP